MSDNARTPLFQSHFREGDLVHVGERQGAYDRDVDDRNGLILFQREGGGWQGEYAPLSQIEATGEWSCACPRVWKIATSSYLRCDFCGRTR